MPLATLPIELWAIILDLILENSVNPANHCDHMNFVQINRQIGHPILHPPINPSCRRLRLVCRFFNNLLSPPSYLIMSYLNHQIQRSVRAVYLQASTHTMGCLKSLIGNPSTSHQITSLDLTCEVDGRSKYPRAHYSNITFYFLFQNSHRLPNVRYLGLSFITVGTNVLDLWFWTKLEEAFLLLSCLVLRPSFPSAMVYIPMLTAAVGTVTLENLKILRLDWFDLYNGLHMPQLRHASLGRCSQSTIITLARSRHLESALFYWIPDDVPVELSSLPNLKLLGIPNCQEDSTLPFPRSYPLNHLCVHVQHERGKIQALPKWLVRAFDCLPQVSQITLDIITLWQPHQSYMERNFRKEIERKGLVVEPFLPGTAYMVIKRAQVKQNADPDGLWRRWTTFLGRSSHKLEHQ